MMKAVWLLAGVVLASSQGFLDKAMAEDDSPPMLMPNGKLLPPMVMPKAVPQSPEALACVNTNGVPQARVDACSRIIDAKQWKGKRIAWAYANRCVAQTRLGHLDRALSDCAEAIDQDPELAFAYQWRGEIHRKRDERDKALEDFDKAVALGAKNATLFSGRGLMLLLKGDAQNALADYDQEVAVAGGDADAWMDRGSAQLGLGDDAKATADFTRATELAPGNALAWFNRGAAAFGAGDKAQAADNLERALKLDPQNAYAALWLFLTRDGSGQAKADLQAFAGKATKKDWPFAVTQLYLGAADAAQTLAAAKTGDQECEARFYIGAENLLKGAKDDAAVTLRRAVESCPKNFIEYFSAVAELKKLATADK